jgi:putative ABC transport system ATP-binding protein
MVALMGPSGSGKSTLMHIIGLLDRPTSGSYELNGRKIELGMSDRALARLRSQMIGFVFQSFFLLPRLSALENVLVPSQYRLEGKRDRIARAEGLLHQLGLANRMRHLPSELSGGEKQRVAIARALMNEPSIILADEPTGNLDQASGKEVMRILTDLHKEGKTVLVITHDAKVAASCQRTIRILDGKLEHHA